MDELLKGKIIVKKEAIKEQLKSYQMKKKECDQLKKLIEKLESEVCHPKTTCFNKASGAPSYSGSSVENFIMSKENQIEKLLRIYQKKHNELLKALLETEKRINSLGTKERILMRYHYIEGLTFEKVAQKTNYSVTQIKRLHRQSISKLENM